MLHMKKLKALNLSFILVIVLAPTGGVHAQVKLSAISHQLSADGYPEIND